MSARPFATLVAVLALMATQVIAAGPAADPAKRPLALEDLGAVKAPSSLTLSPDGRRLAYVLEDQVHVVDIAVGEPRAVTSAGSSAWDPAWSRDGRWLYFLSDRAGGRQLWKLPLAGFGEAIQVTRLPHGVDSLRLSADESRLLLSFTDAELARNASVGAGDAATARQPWVITRLQFKEDAGDGYLTGDRAEHWHALDLSTGKLTRITAGPFTEEEAAWSPDGRQVVFVSNREAEPDASYRTDLWVMAADGQGEPRRLTADERVKASPAWSPDGRTIAFLVAEDGVYGLPQVAAVPAAGGEARILTSALDRWVTDLRFSRDGRWIYFAYEEAGGSRIARVPAAGGRIETVVTGDRGLGEFDVAADGTIAAVVEAGNRGPEIHAFRRGGERRLTRINDAFLDSVALGEKRSVRFSSADGTEIQAFVTTPPGHVPGRRLPAVLHVHGGPVGQFAWGYTFKAQVLAAAGYLVIEPNPRGSTGRGQDFVRAIHRSWGITDYDDVIAAVDWAIEAGLADPARLAVTGYSYGGYMTNVVITRTDRFKAAASGAGHSLIAANYGHDIYQKWYNWELGPPWEDREAYDRLSPLLRADRVTTPTLFLGGREDWNVPLLNAELFYQSLRMRGIDTQLVVYPGAHHGGWPPEFERDYLERVREWFDRYLK